MTRIKILRVLYGVLLLSLLLVLYVVIMFTNQINDCTIFTIISEDSVVYGNNEDWHASHLRVRFVESTEDAYGAIFFGHQLDGSDNFEGSVNDQGLSWDLNSLPKVNLTPHPERPYSLYEDNFFGVLSREIATVEEAIALSEVYDFGSTMTFQVHIADKSGDAVIISPGPDGELAYTRMNREKGYLISTNFNHAIEGNGKMGWRYETADDMLATFNQSTIPIVEYSGNVLDSVSLNMLTTFTIYSNVNDLTNGTVDLYYKSQFDDGITLNLEEELSNGTRTVDMADLFPDDVVEQGDHEYDVFERRFFAAMIGAIVLGLGVLTTTVIMVVKYTRKTRHKVTDKLNESCD